MIQTELLDKSASFNLLNGCSSSLLNNEVFIIGGNEDNIPNSNPFLQIRPFDVLEANWSKTFVSSHNILNRSFHSSITINEIIYIYGGNVKNYDSNYNLEISKEIITIEKSIFGVKCSLLLESELTANQGATANLVGKELNQGFIFGGVSVSPQKKFVYSSQGLLFQVEKEPFIRTVEVDKTTPSPPARAFHSSCVCGEENQFVVVFGGKTDKNVCLNDLWVLDLTEVITLPAVEVEPVVDKKGKAPPKGKCQEVKLPSAIWTKLNAGISCDARYLHSSFLNKNKTNGNYSLFVFGGLSTTGILPLGDFYTASLTVVDRKPSLSEELQLVHQSSGISNSISGGVLACAVMAVPIEESVYQFLRPSKSSPLNSPVKINNNNNNNNSSQELLSTISGPSVIFLFGGKRSSKENISMMIPLDLDSRLLQKIRRAVLKNNPELDSNSFSKKPLDTHNRRIEYPDGSVYVGDVLFPNQTDELSVQEDVLTDEEDSLGPTAAEVMIPHGNGMMTYADGSIYTGDWQSGKKVGRGKLTQPNGQINEGEFSNDVQTGSGTQSSPDGFLYTGSFSQGTFHWSGEIRYSNSDVFQGEFANGLREGKGVYKVSKDGSCQYGTWVKDKITGIGSATDLFLTCLPVTLKCFPDPLAKSIEKSNRFDNVRGSYTGPLFDGLPAGENGICRYEDKSEYKGEWKVGKRNGYGTYIFANGDEYIGKWVGDKRCGFGRLTSSLSFGYEGNWDNNLPHGEGILYLKDGSTYSGTFVNGKREGYGKLSYPHSESLMFNGMWKEDQFITN